MKPAKRKLPWWYVVVIRLPRFIFSATSVIVPSKVRIAFSGLRMKMVFRCCTKRRYGAWTLYCANELSNQGFFAMCEKASTLLFQHDPKRYQRLRTNIKNIVLYPMSESFFEPATLSCLLNDYDPERLDLFTLSLVHESTHGYLYSKGLRYSDAPDRHEQLCIEEEYRSIKRISMNRWPELSDESRDQWLKQWTEYFAAKLKSQWWKTPQRDQVGLDALRNLLGK